MGRRNFPCSTVKAHTEKSMGARFWSSSSASSNVAESFPPESATATRSPSRIILKRWMASPTLRSSVFSSSTDSIIGGAGWHRGRAQRAPPTRPVGCPHEKSPLVPQRFRTNAVHLGCGVEGGRARRFRDGFSYGAPLPLRRVGIRPCGCRYLNAARLHMSDTCHCYVFRVGSQRCALCWEPRLRDGL